MNTIYDLNKVDASWRPLLKTALAAMDVDYLATLATSRDWLPGPQQLLNAFTLPQAKTRYILFGESPYPRTESANGYAFWDASVTEIWSATGMTKAVNRATSLRNFIKMLLLVAGELKKNDLSQSAIAKISKAPYVKTLSELFHNLLQQGFLLLNVCPVLSQRPVAQEAKFWHPFMSTLLTALAEQPHPPELLLFGKIAETVQQFPAARGLKHRIAEHPYNLSFIHNSSIQDFFKPFALLQASDGGRNKVESGKCS